MSQIRIQGNSPVTFKFRREGGTRIGVGLYVWAEAFTPNERCVASSELTKLDSVETVHFDLPAADYVVVCQLYVRRVLNGRYGYTLSCEDQAVFEERDATLPDEGENKNYQAFDDQFVLKVV